MNINAEILKEQVSSLIDEFHIDEIKLDENPWCDYYPETGMLHIGTIKEDEEPRLYDAYIPFDDVIRQYIDDSSGLDGITDIKSINDTKLFIEKLRVSADLLESKITSKGNDKAFVPKDEYSDYVVDMYKGFRL
jgi:hypothetical protein